MSGEITRFFDDETMTPLRVVAGPDGEPRFVAKDVCEALGLADHKSALRVLDDDEKGGHEMPTLGGPQKMLVVTEPGLYRLIGKGEKPDARRFQRWVFHDVLPSIRKTGRYQLTGVRERAEAAVVLMDAFARHRDAADNPADRALMAASLDHVRTQALSLTGQAPKSLPPARRPMTAMEYATEIYGIGVEDAKTEEVRIGTRASNAHLRRHGRRPDKNDQLVKGRNGKMVSGVNVYEPDDFDLLQEVCDGIFED